MKNKEILILSIFIVFILLLLYFIFYCLNEEKEQLNKICLDNFNQTLTDYKVISYEYESPIKIECGGVVEPGNVSYVYNESCIKKDKWGRCKINSGEYILTYQK